MAIDHEELVKNGVDIAGAINEVALNKFSAAHHRAVPDVYRGVQRFGHLDNDIEIRFAVRNPIEFDFSSQIAPSRFKRLWFSHLKAKGAPESLTLRRLITTPPNLRLSCSDLYFEIVVFEGHSSTVLFSVDFSWDLEALAAVHLKGSALTLDPLRVSFSAGSTFIASEVAAKVAALAAPGGGERKEPHPATVGDPADPVWCAKLEQLILLMVNQVLATQISNFIRAWELPRAIEVTDGIALSPTYLAIHGDDLVVGAQVVTPPVGPSILQSQLDTLVSEFARRAEAEYSSLSDEQLRTWHPEHSPTLRWMGDYVRNIEQELLAQIEVARARRGALFAPNLQILFNDEIFDILAARFLTIDKGWSASKELDRLLKGQIGWWFKVQNARAAVIPGGVELHADVRIGAKAQVCHFDIDPKHFGSWRCYGPKLELYPIPDFGLQALPSFSADGVYLSARLLTTGIGIRFLDWPSWANDLLGWITGNLTRPLLSSIAAIIALFRVRILRYPHHFPGTGLEWTPNFNTAPTNEGPYLVFSADPEFR
jgi:hypothetical protein